MILAARLIVLAVRTFLLVTGVWITAVIAQPGEHSQLLGFAGGSCLALYVYLSRRPTVERYLVRMERRTPDDHD